VFYFYFLGCVCGFFFLGGGGLRVCFVFSFGGGCYSYCGWVFSMMIGHRP
jgi:hypothetical protein